MLNVSSAIHEGVSSFRVGASGIGYELSHVASTYYEVVGHQTYTDRRQYSGQLVMSTDLGNLSALIDTFTIKGLDEEFNYHEEGLRFRGRGWHNLATEFKFIYSIEMVEPSTVSETSKSNPFAIDAVYIYGKDSSGIINIPVHVLLAGNTQSTHTRFMVPAGFTGFITDYHVSGGSSTVSKLIRGQVTKFGSLVGENFCEHEVYSNAPISVNLLSNPIVVSEKSTVTFDSRCPTKGLPTGVNYGITIVSNAKLAHDKGLSDAGILDRL